ncbi:MAG: ComF family protein [Cardiobacterium sp.]|nr:MAG: ComF family protein [Cardiobacterium sp.]
MITRWLTRFLQPRCIGCGATEIVGLCEECAARLPHLDKHCPTCANTVADDRFACGACLRRPPAYSRLLVRWQFRELVRSTILRSKFHADRLALRVLEDEACRLLHDYPITVDAVLAMPIANNRLHQRGFNQTLFPARAAARQLDVPLVAEGIFYKQARQPQSLLRTHAARRRNIHDAFAVRGALPARLLLVDDVVTSGATLHEAALALRAAGVQDVIALATAAAHRGTS